MSDINELRYYLKQDCSRFYGGFAEINESAIALYDELARNHRILEFELPEGKIGVMVNWRALQSEFDELSSVSRMSKLSQAQYYENISKNSEEKLIDIKILNATKDFSSGEFEFILSTLSFLINISVCGSLHLYNARYTTPNNQQFRYYKSLDMFEKTAIDEIKLELGIIKQLPFSVVWKWFKGLGIESRQISFNPISKAIYSIMRSNEACRSFEQSCWLLNAFDGLFGVSSIREPQKLIEKIKSNFQKKITNKKAFKEVLIEIQSYIKTLFSADFNALHVCCCCDEADNVEFTNLLKADRLALIAVGSLQEIILETANTN